MDLHGSFKGQKAPCGRVVDGEHYRDRDHEVVVTRETIYQCGCQSIEREYSDGCVARTVVRHDGTVLVEEILSER